MFNSKTCNSVPHTVLAVWLTYQLGSEQIVMARHLVQYSRRHLLPTIEYKTGASNKSVFFLFESPEKETNKKESKFGIHWKQTSLYTMISLSLIAILIRQLVWKAAVGNNQCGPVCWLGFSLWLQSISSRIDVQKNARNMKSFEL